MQSEQFVEENFAGSLPAFLAAFGSRKRLSEEEIQELEHMITRMRAGEAGGIDAAGRPAVKPEEGGIG